MSITHIGSNTQDKTGGLDLTFAFGGISYQAGDMGIVFVKQCENTTQRIWDDDGGGGNGWIQRTYNRTTGGRDMETAIYTKILTASETDPTFTWASGVTTEPMSGMLEVYRGTQGFDEFSIQDLQYANAQNDANPPNPSVNIDFSTSTIVVFHGATHDDISAVAAPTGFQLRSQVWSGTSNDHRNVFSADLINVGTTGSYTPPDWQHTVLNSTPEYHTYTIILQEALAIGVNDFNTTEKFNWGDTGLIVTGFGFESIQNTGKVEIWSDVTGTIKQIQTIDTWSDTSISIDTVQGSLPNNQNVFLVVTNDNGDISKEFTISVGQLPYSDEVLLLNPDHYWTFNNNYLDTAGVLTRNASAVNGSPTFTTNPLTRGSTHAFTISAQGQRIEIADSSNMNTGTIQTRTMGGWVRVSEIQDSFICFYEEGGGVNNLAFFMGMGGVLIAQQADTGDDNVHAYSDFKLAPNRDYHILFRYDYTGTDLFELLVDGVLQSTTFGNPLTSSDLDAHSGDVGWGDAEGSLEVFGTDITFPAGVTAYYNDWATWTVFINENTAREKLFELGAREQNLIISDTEINMQADFSIYDNTTFGNHAMTFKVEPCTGGDFTLIANGHVMDDFTSVHLQYMGADTLTIVNSNGSNYDINKISTPNGGTVVIENTVITTITGIPSGVEWHLYEKSVVPGLIGTVELAGTEIKSDNDPILYSDRYSTDTDVILQIIESGVEERNIEFTLINEPQTILVNLVTETNI